MSDDGGCLGVIILIVIVVLVVRSCDVDQRVDKLESKAAAVEAPEQNR